jgi:hypothetical protein
LWADGNAYFDSEVRIGSTDVVSGYRLTVDGKIIAEELKVQMSELWPDYVFHTDYDLKEISQLEAFIKANHHLPGIPSASEVDAVNGIEVGEMNRLLLEKVEELTLYIIELQKQIDVLNNKIQ